MADTIQKLKKNATPHCMSCGVDLKYVAVRGEELPEFPEIKNFSFKITIAKGEATAEVDVIDEMEFRRTSNPTRFLVEVEKWVENVAEEAHCPYCRHTVKLARVSAPIPVVDNTQAAPPQIMQLLQQMQQQSQNNGPFAMTSSTYGQNRAQVQAIFDSKLTDQDLIDILTDLDSPPPPGTSRNDLIVGFLDYLYS
jgi:hypothetical protein